MRVPGYRRPSSVPPTTFGESMINLGVCATILLESGRLSFCVPFDFAGVAVWCWIAFRCAQHRAARFRAGTVSAADDGPKWRGWVVALLVLSTVLSVKYYECPHARTFGIGMWGISYSRNGPCKGGMHNGGERIAGNWWFAYLRRDS
jgi:hypothetical protein